MDSFNEISADFDALSDFFLRLLPEAWQIIQNNFWLSMSAAIGILTLVLAIWRSIRKTKA